MDYHGLTRENEALVLAAEKAGEPVVGGLPIKFNIELTADCNIHCRMCECHMLRRAMRRQGKRDLHLPRHLFRAAVERVFPRCSLVNPSLVGEPLMLPYLDELIEAAAEKAVRLDLVTNGVLLEPALAERLLPRLARLMLSFDGAERVTFEKIRNGASFDKVTANLAAFSRRRAELGLRRAVRLWFSVVLRRENIAELPRIVELAAAHEVDTVIAGHLIVFQPELAPSSLVHVPEQTEEWLARARQRGRELGVDCRLPAPLRDADTGHLFRRAVGCEWEETGAGGGKALPQEVPFPEAVLPEESGPAGTDGVPQEEFLVETLITEKGPDRWPGRYYCQFPWRETFVGLGGEVAPCCAPGRPVFGNAFEQDIGEIWNGEDYRHLRESLVSGKLTEYCRQCKFLREAGSL